MGITLYEGEDIMRFLNMSSEVHIVTELKEYDFENCPPGFCWPLHLHHFHQFDVIRSGKVTVKLGSGRFISAEAGDGILIPPLIWHGYYSRFGYLNCSFRVQIAPFYWRSLGNAIQKIKLPLSLLKTIEDSGRTWRGLTDIASRQSIMALGTLCFLRLMQGSRIEPKITDYDPLRHCVWQLLEKIQLHPYSHWTLTDMARDCHLSVDYFSKIFYKLVGKRPRDYLLDAKFHAVASVLTEQQTAIKDLADQTGYGSVHTFTRAFKRVIGVSPGQYRCMPHRF